MTSTPSPTWLSRLADKIDAEGLRPDFGRATRATFALIVPLILAATGHLPFETIYFVLPAHGMACLDVRGPYALRLAVLAVMAFVLAAAAAGGTAAHDSWILALVATGVLAVVAGGLRHLTADYGQSLAATTALVFFMGLLGHYPGPHWPSVLAGATWSLLLQVARWPIRPQQPLRHATAESWLAAADLFDALSAAGNASNLESAARLALERNYALFESLGRTSPLRTTLEALNTACAQLITRAVGLSTAIDALPEATCRTLRAPLSVLLESLAFNSRQVALATVSNQPGHVAVSDVRLRRAIALLKSLEAAVEKLRPEAHESQPLTFLIRSLEGKLRATHDALHALGGHGESRANFPLELFDLATWRWRPLAPVLNLRPGVERAIVRFTLRLAALLMIGVCIVYWWPLPHRYWLPFTIVVVSQIDFGATRKRAVQRLGGTFVGSLLGSAILFLHLPAWGIFSGIAVTGFGFAYWLRNRYGLAVIFVTVMVVLLTEMSGPATLQLTAERLGLTAIGGALALVAAYLFWPAWERHRTLDVLATALRTTAQYAQVIRERLVRGGAYTPDDVKIKRLAETAAGDALASLGRMYADPKNQRAGVERAAVLANGTRRITRMLNLLLIHETPNNAPAAPEALAMLDSATSVLNDLATGIDALDAGQPVPAHTPVEAVATDWVTSQLSRILAEAGAMQMSLAAWGDRAVQVGSPTQPAGAALSVAS